MPSYSAYKRQIAVLDADDITWITVKGNHIPIKKGQNKSDAIKEFFANKGSGKSSASAGGGEKETRKSLALKIAKLVKPKDISEQEYARRMLKGVGAIKPYSLGDLQKEYERRKSDAEKAEKGGFENPHKEIVNKYVPKQYQKAYNSVLERVMTNKDNKKINQDRVISDAVSTGKFSEKDIKDRVANFKSYYEKGKKAIPSGKMMPYDTMRRYTTGGKWEDDELVDATWKPERLKVQKEILAKDFKDWKSKLPKKGEKPKLVILGGRGGSGKSAFTDGTLGSDGFDKNKFLVVDPDAYKEQLPEYKGLIDKGSKYGGLNAWEVHEESSFMKKQALATAKGLGINVVLDGTLAKIKSVSKTIEDFKKAGYDVEGAYMHLPREKSAVRGLLRGMREDKNTGKRSGRWVPTENLLNMKDNEEVFTQLLPQFSKWSMYDNDVPRGEKPKLIAKSE